MPTTLTRNEIRERAAQFVASWRDESRERAEKDTFWNEFFFIFGVVRRQVATFERHAQRTSTGRSGFMDVFWPGYLVGEHKSRGANLAATLDGQALDYLDGLPAHQLPRLVVVSDFARFRVLDLDPETRERGEEVEFSIDDLLNELDRFMFLAGYEQRTFQEQDAVNVEAAELLGAVYDELEEAGYTDHHLRVLVVRLLFMLFADDTGLWGREQFSTYLRNRTVEDGHDLGLHIIRLFEILDTPEPQRSSALDEELASFPYVNGGLFSERIAVPDCTRTIRDSLLEACDFDWSNISPAIFGSMFQSVMDKEARRSLGAHYTTERNILKLLHPLFLDGLIQDLADCGNSAQRLRNLHEKMAGLTFFDPACGCGNFLVITYRELRRLETELLRRLYPTDTQRTLDLEHWRKVSVSQFYGIEIEEFPVRIAETAMYLVDHLENEALGATFGANLVDLPLAGTATIRVGNALRIDWNDVLPASECNYILGNPPFAGKKRRNADQQRDMNIVFGEVKNGGVLDYVTCWYRTAMNYMPKSGCLAAFVSTSSITQGEQVNILWPGLFKSGLEIDFAHRTFNWSSEARRRAHVHVVIIGFSPGGQGPRRILFDYDDIDGDPVVRNASSINPYLADAPVVFVEKRRTPLVPVPEARFGSMPNDDGWLLLMAPQVRVLQEHDPIATKYLRRLISAREWLHGEERWCFWLVSADPADIRSSPHLKRCMEKIHDYRAASNRAATKALAATPSLFGEIRQPTTRYLCLPRHTSENRSVVPMAFFDPEDIAHDSTLTVAGADNYLFGVLQSSMFITWLGAVGGRIKSDFRLSTEVVYNTFPFPSPSDTQRQRIADAAETVLTVRNDFPDASLADLYDPRATPEPLVRAHQQLDRMVDTTYGRRSLTSTADRLSVLFDRYTELLSGGALPGVAPAQAVTTTKRRRTR